MKQDSGVFLGGLRILARNKRYVIWFYLLNLVLASMGAAVFRSHVHAILDNSLYSQRLLHGFDVFVFLDLLAKPEMGNIHGLAQPAVFSSYLFVIFSLLFMPGVLDGFASERRLSREDFWATCGRNVWRFVRLFLFNLVIAGITFGVLAGINGGLGKAADNSTNEKLPFYVELVGSCIIFLIMTWIRTWFDLAEANVVLSYEGRVRKSIRRAAGFATRGMGLFSSYVLISLIAVAVLVFGLWLWDIIVPPASVIGGFLIGQSILFLWLVARFWQRACAVVVCMDKMKAEAAEEFVPAVTPIAQPLPMADPGAGI